MKAERLILKNTALLTAGKGLGDLCIFFFLVYFARIFGTDILGKYAFAMSIGGLLAVLINLGLNTLMVREVSKDKRQNSKYMGHFLITQGIFAVIIWIVIGLIALVSNFSNDTKLIVVLIGSYHVFYRFIMLFQSEFKAHEEMQYSAFLEISHKMLILFLGITSIIIWKNTIITLTVYPISAFSMCALGFIISVSKYGWPELKFDYAFIKNSLITAIPFFVIIILTKTYVRISIILLTYIKGEGAVGIFCASDRLWITITSILTMFSSALFPAMSKLSVNSRDRMFKLSARSMRLLGILLLPLSLIIFILSKQIILITYGEQFIESVQVLQILSWSLILIGLNYILYNLLIVTNHQKALLKIRIIGYLVYLALSLPLIWKYSFIGLAFAIVIFQVFLFTFTFFYVSKVIYTFEIKSICFAPFVSCFLSLLAFYFISDYSVWITVPAILIVYAVGVFVFKGVHWSDFVFLKQIAFGKVIDVSKPSF
jgi:O-antigen/teichoic acid export membrane protein